MRRLFVLTMVIVSLLGMSTVTTVAQDKSLPMCTGPVAFGHPLECNLPPELDGKALQMDFLTLPACGEFALSQTSNAIIYTLTTFCDDLPGLTDAFSVVLTDIETLEEFDLDVFAYLDPLAPDETFSFDFPTQGPSGGPPPQSLTRQIMIPMPAPSHYLEFYPFSAPTLGTVSIVDDTKYKVDPERKFTFTYTPNSMDRDVGVWDSFIVRTYDINGHFPSYVTVNIYLPPTSEPIVVTDQAFSGPTRSPFSGNLTASGGEGPLEFALGVGPAYGNVVLSADGAFTYTPYADEAIDDDFLVSVTDGTTSREFMVSITLVSPPLNQVIDPEQQFTGDPRFPIDGSLAQLGGAAELTYSLDSPPNFGSVIVDSDGHFTFIANDISHPGDSFTVLVTDGSGDSATITVSLIFDIDESVPTDGSVAPGKGGSGGGGNGSGPRDPRSPVTAPVSTPIPEPDDDTGNDSCTRCD